MNVFIQKSDERVIKMFKEISESHDKSPTGKYSKKDHLAMAVLFYCKHLKKIKNGEDIAKKLKI